MNEHIKQLAEQAGFCLWTDEDWKPEGQVIDWSNDYDKELEEYTRLVIAKSAELAISDIITMFEIMHDTDNSYKNCNHNYWLFAANKIREKFGV